MTFEALSILIYTLLIFGAITVQATHSAATAEPAYGFSNRAGPQPGKSDFGRRIGLTLGNLNEGAIMYLPLALLAVSLDISNAGTYSAALVTVISRVLYVPIFLSGVTIIRTLVWAPSFFAIPFMSVGILLGAPP